MVQNRYTGHRTFQELFDRREITPGDSVFVYKRDGRDHTSTAYEYYVVNRERLQSGTRTESIEKVLGRLEWYVIHAKGSLRRNQF